MAIRDINEFEKNNNIPVYVLRVEGSKIYICRKLKHNGRKNVVNLLLISDGDRRPYRRVKSLTRLLTSSNSKHKRKQHFCINCLQGFHSEESRDNYYL